MGNDTSQASSSVEQGDFSKLAKEYVNRPGYSDVVLSVLTNYLGTRRDPSFAVADIGAGTGKLTEMLLALELQCNPVEPNDAMREEGVRATSQYDVTWRKGSAEATGLESSSVNWVTMASAFHWADTEKALEEFHRILKPGGSFTALWNPRDLQRSELHMRIEDRIHSIVPDLDRVSSGSSKYTSDMPNKLQSTGLFTDCFFLEAEHEVEMSKDRYLGAWRSVNDIQAQAGPERFEEILSAIEEEILNQETVVVPYKTRAWTVTAVSQ